MLSCSASLCRDCTAGFLILIAELQYVAFLDWFSFLCTLIGLGGFYIFVGGLALGSEWYAIVIGTTRKRSGHGRRDGMDLHGVSHTRPDTHSSLSLPLSPPPCSRRPRRHWSRLLHGWLCLQR